MPVAPDRYTRLAKALRPDELVFEPSTLESHSGDKWFARSLPEAVALPRSTDAVCEILRFARDEGIPVTPRGAGHGYVGGCVPVSGGIVLSVARMSRLIELNTRDFVAVVQPGIITAQLQAAVERRSLFYPPDPASREDCSIGGNIATNAGGPRCLKYGVTRDYVLGLEVVLAGGERAHLGGRCHKNKTGFDLHRLFVGSEGLLGVVTEATLKLLPLPPTRAAVSAGFSRLADAARAIRAIFASGFSPSAVEIADRFTLDAARRKHPTAAWAKCGAHLLVEIDGRPSAVRSELRDLAQTVAGSAHPLFVRRAVGADAVEEFWKIRRGFSYALRDTGLTKLNEDIVIPRGRLEALFALAARLQKRHRLPIACFGHAGDGNIHVNVMVDREDPDARTRADRALDELFREVLRLGGAVTGEHGIGLAKLPWWPMAASPEVRRWHERLKIALDDRGILNPGKFLGAALANTRSGA